MRALLATILLALAPLAMADAPVTQEMLVKAHGADHLSEVAALRFTFNVDRGDNHTQRSWEWHPQTGAVRLSYEKDGKPVVVDFNHDEVDDSSTDDVKSADRKFINDSFWLAWPIHLAWSDQDLIKDQGMKPNPITGESVHTVEIVYPSDGGYTPGDMYELFLGLDNRPTAWAYHKGAKPDGSPMTWETYKHVGPLTLATDHWNKDKSFRLYFTDLAWKDKDDAEWQDAK